MEKDIVNDYVEGKMKIKDLLKKYGLSNGKLYSILEKHDVKPKRKKAKVEITKEQLEDLYLNQKLGTNTISKKLNCGHTTIMRYMKEYKIPFRTKEENAYIQSLHREVRTGMNLKEINEKVISLFDEGESIQSICSHINLGRRAITKILKQHNRNPKKNKYNFFKFENINPKGNKLSEEAKQKILEGRRKAFENRKNEIFEFKQYRKTAGHQAKKHFNYIPYGLEIDHMFSVNDGFDHNLHVDIISHPANLRLLTIEENRKKSRKSIIEKNDLIELIKQW